nr:MAG TPA: hypothetical protein [Caudoviricetes sp.]
MQNLTPLEAGLVPPTMIFSSFTYRIQPPCKHDSKTSPIIRIGFLVILCARIRKFESSKFKV